MNTWYAWGHLAAADHGQQLEQAQQHQRAARSTSRRTCIVLTTLLVTLGSLLRRTRS